MPAVVAGYDATHGIAKQFMPFCWEIAFPIIGAVAVGVAAFLRVVGWQVTTNPGLARA